MARGKKHTPEQIVGLLRQIEVGVANGKTTPTACRVAKFYAVCPSRVSDACSMARA
jgi:hypothetical protein